MEEHSIICLALALNRSIEREREMRMMQVDFFADMEEQGSTVAMDVDEMDTLDRYEVF